VVSTLGINEGQQGNNPCSFNCICKIALLLCSQASQTTGKDLSPLCNEFLKQVHIFVIDGIAWLNRRKTLLEKGARHELKTVERLEGLQTHLISLWRVILLSCGQNFMISSRSVVFRLFFSVV
tara:strand:+ start:3062 stop:3430 length:369 start_codon:yes stop_codon:yes gene_type:complete